MNADYPIMATVKDDLKRELVKGMLTPMPKRRRPGRLPWGLLVIGLAVSMWVWHFSGGH